MTSKYYPPTKIAGFSSGTDTRNINYLSTMNATWNVCNLMRMSRILSRNFDPEDRQSFSQKPLSHADALYTILSLVVVYLYV